MSKEETGKKLYSFWIDRNQLDRLTRLSGFLTGSGKKVTVSSLINMSIDELLERHEKTLTAMEKLSESVQEFNKN